MKKLFSGIISIIVIALLTGCAGGASSGGPSYVILTMAVDTSVPVRQVTFAPTETPIPSPTLTVTITPTPTPLVGCVTINSIFVRSGPGANFPAVSGLTLGECVTVLAYSPDKQWAQIDTGWVSLQYLNFTHLTLDQELTLAAGATITPTPTLLPTIKK